MAKNTSLLCGQMHTYGLHKFIPVMIEVPVHDMKFCQVNFT